MKLFNLTEDEIKSQLFALVTQNVPQITHFNSGGVMRGILEIVAKFISLIYDLLNLTFQNAFVNSATGIWLELKCSELGLLRIPSSKTKGKIVFKRDTVGQNVNIPVNTVVQSRVMLDGHKYKYFTTETVILNENSLSVEAEIIAEMSGSDYNLPPFSIVNLGNPINGIDAIENNTDWIIIPGVDAETDESLRNRYLLKWSGLSGMNASAYESWVREVSGVGQVVIIPVGHGGGSVDIIITAVGGSADDELINAVYETVNQNKPWGIDIFVYRPTAVSINLNLHLVIYSGAIVDSVVLDIQTAVYEYFSEMVIGQDFVLSDIIAKLKSNQSVKDIIINDPLSNIAVNIRELAELANLTITTSIAEAI